MQFSGKTFKMFLKKLGTIALLSDEHPSTLFGIVIFVIDEHPLKAPSPISVTLFGIVIFESDEHPEKA